MNPENPGRRNFLEKIGISLGAVGVLGMGALTIRSLHESEATNQKMFEEMNTDKKLENLVLQKKVATNLVELMSNNKLNSLPVVQTTRNQDTMNAIEWFMVEYMDKVLKGNRKDVERKLYLRDLKNFINK